MCDSSNYISDSSSDYDSSIVIPIAGRPRVNEVFKKYYKKKHPELCEKRGRKVKYATEEERREAKKKQDHDAYLRRLDREKLYKEFYEKNKVQSGLCPPTGGESSGLCPPTEENQPKI